MNLQLPDLLSFQYGPLKNVGALELSSTLSESENSDGEGSRTEDIWSAKEITKSDVPRRETRSWEVFYEKSFKEPVNVYISEGGPQVFDRFLSREGRLEGSTYKVNVRRNVRSTPLLHELLQLGQGRESQLFRWSAQEGCFQARIDDVCMSGYSFESFSSLMATFLSYGKTMRNLREFVGASYRSRSSPTIISLASTMSTILSALGFRLDAKASSIHSVLQLQSTFHHPGLLLQWLEELVGKLSKEKDDMDILGHLFDNLKLAEHQRIWAQPLLAPLLNSISSSWLSTMSVLLGFDSHASLKINALWFRPLEDLSTNSESPPEKSHHEVSLASPSSLVGREECEMILETRQGLQMIDKHIPGHPLMEVTRLPEVKVPKLQWQFSWEDIERLQRRVTEYENNVRSAISSFNNPGTATELTSGNTWLLDEENTLDQRSQVAEEAWEFSPVERIESPLQLQASTEETALSAAVHSVVFAETEEPTGLGPSSVAPPITMLAQLSFAPVIAAQTRLVNQACLRLMFRDHNLIQHLSLLFQYCLLGNSTFSSRLSRALFDPDLHVAERRKGHQRSGVSGLRLGLRDSWPPASSELRLVLMGVLTDSYHENNVPQGSKSSIADLPGGLSFAIREMSEEDFEKCRDPNALEALDFLRIQYKPPLPLDVIVSKTSLEKYDMLFRFLLRVLRMLDTTKQLYLHTRRHSSTRQRAGKTSLRFSIEGNQFVSSVCNHVFGGIEEIPGQAPAASR